MTPAALRLAPGRSASFTIRVARTPGAVTLDDGAVLWHGANGSHTRIPVLITR